MPSAAAGTLQGTRHEPACSAIWAQGASPRVWTEGEDVLRGPGHPLRRCRVPPGLPEPSPSSAISAA